jgi:outer membrane protein TolC
MGHPIASLRSAVAALLALGTSACTSYRAVRLPEEPAAASHLSLDPPRLRMAAEELHRPVRSSVPIDLSDGLGPDEAAVLAVLLNPGLIAARDAHGEGEAQVLIAGLLPNPVFGAGLDHPYGPGSAGTHNLVNLSLAMDLKPFIARSARRRAAEAGLDQIDLGVAWQEWQVAQQARMLVVRLGWVRRRMKIASEELAFQEQVAASMGVAGNARDITLDQIGVQRAAAEAVRRALNQLEQAEVETESALRGVLGNPHLGKLGVIEPLDSFRIEAPAPSAEACLTGRLDLAGLRRGYQSEEEQVRAAVLEQFPAVTLGIAYQRNEVSLNFIGGFVNVQLPVFDRNQGQVTLGLATRRRLEHEYVARVATARGDLDSIVRFASLIEHQLPDVHRSIAPLEEIEVKERVAVARGDISRLSYQTVRSALFDQRLQEAAVSQALAEARVAVEATCGGEPERRP